MVADRHYPSPNVNAKLLTNGETLQCVCGCEKLHQLDNDNSALNSELHDLHTQLSVVEAVNNNIARDAVISELKLIQQITKRWTECNPDTANEDDLEFARYLVKLRSDRRDALDRLNTKQKDLTCSEKTKSK
jgi:hypothetical protein